MKKQQQKSVPEDSEMGVVIEDEVLAAGFVAVPKLLLRRAGLTTGAKLVYMGLLSFAWRERGPGPRRRREKVFPGQDTLAAEVGLSRRSVVRHLKELAEKGFVKVTRRGQGKTNVYRVLPLASVVCQPDTSGNGGGDKAAQQGGSNRHLPSFEEEEVEEEEAFLSCLLATTMGHSSSPPKEIERACRNKVRQLLDAGEEAATLRRAIPLLPGQGDVFGPGFLLARWPQLKAELAQENEREQAAAQCVVATAEEEENQAAAEAAWAAIEKLPAEKIRALRERARQSQLSLLAEVRDEHPVLRARMLHLWQKRGGFPHAAPL